MKRQEQDYHWILCEGCGQTREADLFYDSQAGMCPECQDIYGYPEDDEFYRDFDQE